MLIDCSSFVRIFFNNFQKVTGNIWTEISDLNLSIDIDCEYLMGTHQDTIRIDQVCLLM